MKLMKCCVVGVKSLPESIVTLCTATSMERLLSAHRWDKQITVEFINIFITIYFPLTKFIFFDNSSQFLRGYLWCIDPCKTMQLKLGLTTSVLLCRSLTYVQTDCTTAVSVLWIKGLSFSSTGWQWISTSDCVSPDSLSSRWRVWMMCVVCCLFSTQRSRTSFPDSGCLSFFMQGDWIPPFYCSSQNKPKFVENVKYWGHPPMSLSLLC